MMPGISGLDVVRSLRKDPTYDHLRLVPVLMLTALAMEENQEAAQRAGATALLTKPFSPNHLVDVVDRMLRAGVESSLTRT